MTIERTGFEESGVYRLTVSGTFHLSELRDALSEVYAQHPAGTPKRFLWDLREAEIEWPTSEIKEFLEWVRDNRQPGEGKTAVLVGRDLHFGLARMYQAFSTDLPVEFVVFRDLDAAMAWVSR